uniref:Uncharacterized protein n=1 Tax=Anguilla anguilla TaxID=7936 RepID=A0A0E9QPY4_ANGAN
MRMQRSRILKRSFTKTDPVNLERNGRCPKGSKEVT